jgi:hypothetical protein
MPLFSDFVARCLVMVTGDKTLIKPAHMHAHPSDVEVALQLWNSIPIHWLDTKFWLGGGAE